MKLTSKHTIASGYLSYTVQAATINFSPLLFITFEKEFNISLGKISLLIALSFITQLATDAFEAKFSSKLNTRATIVAGHICAAVGMISFAFLPSLLPDPFLGLIISTMLTAIGGGVIEVLISPIVEACPTDEKSASMSLLHSFYSWGSAGVILLSTLFFVLFGIENWKILSVLWSILPIIGAILFALVPIYTLPADEAFHTKGEKHKSLLGSRLFWLFFVVMLAAGASEMAMSQWASSFAETGLGVSKTLGDLLGPCAFAVCMGSARVIYALFGKKIKLTAFFIVSACLCAISYLLAALSPLPLLSLAGCALCGLSVGIMWPGTYSLATKKITFGGTRMFALLALAGDLGCVIGPSVAGTVADAFGDNLQISFIVAAAFPIIILALMPFIMFKRKKAENKNSTNQKGN